MSIQFINQMSSLSVFAGVDEATGEPLPAETWSDKVWVTEFAEALSLDGLVFSWGVCNVYVRHQTYAIPADSHQFTAHADYPTAIIVWLDSDSDDNLTIDTVLLDGEHEAPPAPTAGDDCVKLAWGTIGAGAAAMTLNVLRHDMEV